MQEQLSITTLAPSTAASAVANNPPATAKRLPRLLGRLMLSAVTAMFAPVLAWAQQGQFRIEEASIPDIHTRSGARGGSGTDTTNAGLGQRPNLLQLPGCEKLTNPGNPNSYIKTECFAFPAAFTLGNLGRNGLTKPGLSNFDLSIVRNFQITERISTQLRGEVFNALNHANFGTPANVVFDRHGRVPANAGRITLVATDGRRIQVALKLNF